MQRRLSPFSSLKPGLSSCGLGLVAGCVQQSAHARPVSTAAQPGRHRLLPVLLLKHEERGLWVSWSRRRVGGRMGEQSQGCATVSCKPGRAYQVLPWLGPVPMLESQSHPHAPHPHSSLYPPLPTCLPRLRATRSKLQGCNYCSQKNTTP